MAIERLGPSAAVIAALRAEMARRNERSGHRPPAESGPEVESSPRDLASLRQSLVELASSVPRNDSDALKALRPRVVRAILLWEFGPALREHPDWQAMLESVTQSLEADPAQEVQLARLVSELTR